MKTATACNGGGELLWFVGLRWDGFGARSGGPWGAAAIAGCLRFQRYPNSSDA